jgi:ADP-heptose:LPS heptosyltransferase
MPWRNDLLIQAGNCRKEAGDYVGAVPLYRRAAEDPRERAEADRQLKDLDHGVARAWERARRAGQPSSGEGHTGSAKDWGGEPYSISAQIALFTAPDFEDLGGLARHGSHWNMPIDPTDGRPLAYRPRLRVIQVGNFRMAADYGSRPLLTGVVALRVELVSFSETEAVQARLDGRPIGREPMRLIQRHDDGRNLYVANLWIDTGRHEAGPHSLTVEATLKDGVVLDDQCAVTITHLPPASGLPSSDAYVPSPSGEYDDLLREVASRPATVRDTREMIALDDVASLLAIRIDQLGDLSASLPALRRLRDLFPRAHLAAVVATGLSDVVAASGLVDEVIGLTTAYDISTGQRYLDRDEAQRFHEALGGRSFDVAVDLCPNPESRHLLLLVDARCRAGFYPQQFHFLDFGVEVVSRDPANDHSTQSHASLILSLVETLHLKMRALLPPVPRRVDGDRRVLDERGLQSGRYIVIHGGARHPINRWPVASFLDLAGRLADHTGLEIVMFLDEGQVGDSFLAARTGMSFISGRVPIGELDILLSHAHAVIGNDSGPKHLAAIRGTWTASLHINRLNWSEWGQNGRGIIISKKTPCGGCGLNDERLCGKDVLCLRAITVDEVFDALVKHMPVPAAP